MKKIVLIHRGNSDNNNKVLSFVSQCSHLGCLSGCFDCVLLVFIRRWGRLVIRNLIKHYGLLWLVHFHPSYSFPLFRSSPVAVFLDCGHPYFWNFNSTIPVDVVRVKSYVNWPFETWPHPKRDSAWCCERALKRSGWSLSAPASLPSCGKERCVMQ